MKKIASLALAIVLLICMNLVVALAQSHVDDFTFDPSTGTIIGYCGSGGRVVIPGSIYGVDVTGIGQWAFYECSHITDITVPNTVNHIGQEAFGQCTGLQIVQFGDESQLVGIAEKAFVGCTNLTSITVPKGVQHIFEGTFSGCSSLDAVGLPEGLCTIGTAAFGDCTDLSTINIPAGVENIAEDAFRNCSTLQSVIFGGKNFDLGRHVFDLWKEKRYMFGLWKDKTASYMRNPSLKVIVYPGCRAEWDTLVLGSANLTLENNDELEVICLG